MPPGRPREFDTNQALDDAMDLFWSQGYRATTTRDLEARLGVTQSSLYQAFGSKAQLLNSVLGRYQELVDDKLFDPLRDASDGLDALDRFVAKLSAWLVEGEGRGCLIGRLLGEEARPAAEIEEQLARWRAALESAVGEALRRAGEAGEIPRDTVESRTSVVVGMVLGLNLAVQAGYDREAQEAIAEQIRAEIARWKR